MSIALLSYLRFYWGSWIWSDLGFKIQQHTFNNSRSPTSVTTRAVCIFWAYALYTVVATPALASHAFQHGTALVNLDPANNEQWYWFAEDSAQPQKLSTLLRGVVDLDNFDGIIETVVTLGDGTALVNLNAANNHQWYWFNQDTLLRGAVSLENFDGALEEVFPLGDGTALTKTTFNAPNNQWYWFDQTTLKRGAVSLENFDGAIDQVFPLLDGTALLKTSFSAPNNQWYWFDQTTLQRGAVGLENFDADIDQAMDL